MAEERGGKESQEGLGNREQGSLNFDISNAVLALSHTLVDITLIEPVFVQGRRPQGPTIAYTSVVDIAQPGPP